VVVVALDGAFTAALQEDEAGPPGDRRSGLLDDPGGRRDNFGMAEDLGEEHLLELRRR
jgi:hypothetical protein